MRSLRYAGPRRLEWHDVADVSVTSELSAVVQPITASICDIDRPIIDGALPLPGPFAIGHEGVGLVIDVGDDVRHVRPGQEVAIAWHIACGSCSTCRSGRTAHCEAVPPQAMYGLPSGGTWGGMFDDHLVVPYADAMLTPLPRGLDAITAVSAGDNLSLGREIMSSHIPRGRRRVLVLGWQAVGLYQVAFAAALGAEDILYLDDDPRHRTIAEGYGARSAPGPPDRDHGQFDLIVDASFREAWLRRSVRMLVPEGVVECLGGYFGDVALPVFAMYGNGVTFRVGRANTGPHVQPTVDAIADGQIDPRPVQDSTTAWDDAPEALLEPGLKPVFVRSGRNTAHGHRTAELTGTSYQDDHFHAELFGAPDAGAAR